MPEHEAKVKPEVGLFKPGVMPSRSGGLILVASNGSQIHIPDGEVEATIERMQVVRQLQLRAECNELAGIEGQFQQVFGPKGI